MGICTSYRLESQSKKILEALKTLYKDQMTCFDLKAHQNLDIYCDGCNQCDSHATCVKAENRQLIESVMSSDVVIFAFPIYYGSLSGKSKSLLEAFYGLKNQTLQGKKVIFILSSENEKQEGIAVLELLPWIYKHQVNVSAIETLNGGMDVEEREAILKKIHSAIEEDVLYHQSISFAPFTYLGKTVHIPIKFTKSPHLKS